MLFVVILWEDYPFTSYIIEYTFVNSFVINRHPHLDDIFEFFRTKQQQKVTKCVNQIFLYLE